jgi:hypothetical protein
MERLAQPWLPTFRYAAAAVAIAICVPSAVAISSVANLALSGEIVTTLPGRVTFETFPLDRNRDRELLARIAATPSGDAYFFIPIYRCCRS